jgi:hypothetical protein
MKVFVELEFDEENLGEKWMNKDNLKLLLYTHCATKPNLLEVVSYIEEGDMDNRIEVLFSDDINHYNEDFVNTKKDPM